MNKYRRSFIPPDLRPLVKGSRVEASLEAVSDPTENLLEASDVVVFSAAEDATAQYFVNKARAIGIRLVWVHLESPSALVSFQKCVRSAQARRSPALYVRCPGTDDARLENALAYISDFIEQYPGQVLHGGSRLVQNGSKPLQCSHLWRMDPSEALGIETKIFRPVPKASRVQADEWIVKSVSGERSHVVLLQEVLAGGQATELVPCPVQLQRRIHGRNVRVHVCHSRVIAIAIEASELDYRADKELRGALIELPPEIQNWCIAAARSERLEFVGLDLIQSKTDCSWHCFEMNPSPGYDLFERLIDQDGSSLPITQAILDYLVVGWELRK